MACSPIAAQDSRIEVVEKSADLESGYPEAQSGHLRTIGPRAMTLDPAMVRDAGSAAYVIEIFAGLVKLDTNLNVKPDLAEDWKISSDGLAYTFRLRSGIAFADGKEIAAHDVVFSMERALAPDIASPAASMYLGDIEGVSEYTRGDSSHISGISNLDNHTVRILLTKPVPSLISKLTYPVSFVVDRREVSDAKWYRTPNASGPFEVENWIEGERLVLGRNEMYHTPALLERVSFAVIGAAEGLLGYETGKIDIVPIFGRDIDRFYRSGEPLSSHYRAVPQLSFFYIGFNVNIAPFDDVHVRRAFVRAIDMEKINRVTFRGHQAVAKGVLPRGLPGSNAGRAALEYDPVLARQDLALSRYGTPEKLPDITLLIAGRSLIPPKHIEAMLFFLRDNLNVTVRVQTLDFDAFLLELDDSEHQYQMMASGWIADYPDPENFLEFLFLSTSPENTMGFDDPKIDRLLGEARIESDWTRRVELYQEVEDAVIDQAVVLPMYFGVKHYLVKPYVTDFLGPSGVQEWLSAVRIGA
jgi:ABC-type oligopeptide transport system substrate-binding subunit